MPETIEEWLKRKKDKGRPPFVPDEAVPTEYPGVWTTPDGTYYAASCKTLERLGLMDLTGHGTVCGHE